MEYKEILAEIIKKSLKAGAEQAEAYLEENKELLIRVRKGEIEILKEAQSKGLGIRLFAKKKLGFTYTSDFSLNVLDELVKKTVFLARNSSADDFNGLPEKIESSPETTDLRIYDSQLKNFPTQMKIDLAKRAEDASFAADKKITNSDGAEYRDHETRVYLANSSGADLSFQRTYISLSCSPIAEKDGEKRSNYFWDAKSLLEELEPPEKIGRTATERTIRMLGSKKIDTQKVPIIFDPFTSSGFLAGLSYGVNGDLASKNSTFLARRLDQKVGSELLNVWDDGSLPKGLGSRPFDGEGTPTQRKKVFDNGVLKTFLHNSYSARKMKTISTGNASRGYDSIPRISALNFYLENGQTDPAEIIRSVKKGFYVTDLAGFGMNIVSGDYSQMAEGLWIEDGVLTFPVSQVTIAGTILEMLNGIELVGNDLTFRGSISAPTLKFSEMVVSGK
ncbi:MAG: TldD/PmbA family protein [candidate division Zixibacteria bacterium]|nr:TldD/PmbA family protein [candidate division Zixibacteria bacterium]